MLKHEILCLVPDFLLRSDSIPNVSESFSLSLWSPAQRSALERLYSQLGEVERFAQAHLGNTLDGPRKIQWGSIALLFSEMKKIAPDPSDNVRAIAWFEMRSGALQALLSHAKRWVALDAGRIDFNCMAQLAREHARVMRHHVEEFAREHPSWQRGPLRRTPEEVIGRWGGRPYRAHGCEVAVSAHSFLDRTITLPPDSWQGLERILVQLVNNAAKFSSERTVSIAATELPKAGSLRVVVRNPVDCEHAQRLEEILYHGESLFDGGVSTRKKAPGLGLLLVAQRVGAAFGFDPFMAEQKGCVGIRVEGGEFSIWFHWPTIGAQDVPIELATVA